MLVEMKVKNLAFDLSKSGAMVFLEEINGKRILPIWIGIFEANAIALELRKISTARPMTHDLILNIIKGLEAEATKVVVTELKDNTFYAIIHINCREGEVEIDSRPSDAIAVALRVGTPIYVNEEVINQAGHSEETKEDNKTEEFMEWLEKLDPDDFRYKM
ncbi:MAG: bifunctional nuclease family protein [Deltaproteobacteria bacterium]|nr:bifunctional nuclease family protein [Deltaproteobacteria bacterium]